MGGLRRLFEPEESVGALWHSLVRAYGEATRYPDAAVTLKEMGPSLAVFFRGLGGLGGVEIKGILPEKCDHRRTWRQKLAGGGAYIPAARFDGEALLLPAALDIFPDQDLNADLYRWLAAFAACAAPPPQTNPDDLLVRDLARLRYAQKNVHRTLTQFPGLAASYSRLAFATASNRIRIELPPFERALEDCIQHFLNEKPLNDVRSLAMLDVIVSDEEIDPAHWRAQRGYRTFAPVAVWCEVSPSQIGAARNHQEDEESGGASDEEDERTYRARREQADQINREDSLILHRFESVLSWAEMLDVNRAVEEDEEDNARKAADDHDTIGLADTSKKPSSKLRLDLDLAPAEADQERLSAKHAYPEWDFRKDAYLPDHCRVLAHKAEGDSGPNAWRPDQAAFRRIRAVRRQFEALRPKRERHRAQMDGEELDMDALVRARADLVACGAGGDRFYSQIRETSRDLSVSVLFDASRSTESWVDGAQVIAVAREALTALALGLSSVGDEYAIHAFSSCRRDRVFMGSVKDFDESLGAAVMSRIAALKPGHYTRLGAAVRHTAAGLSARPHQRRLLLVITDGKPNDLDHYEGRYGVEDSFMAVREARRAGLAVFGVTIDRKARDYFPRIFGRNGFAMVPRPDRLVNALPLVYRHLVA